MKDGQRLIVKVIKSEDDLPKEDDWYLCKPKGAFAAEVMFNPGDESYKKNWLEGVDWYLIPESQITDADIEAYANGIANPESKMSFERGEWMGIKEGAKAMRDNEIKHIEK